MCVCAWWQARSIGTHLRITGQALRGRVIIRPQASRPIAQEINGPAVPPSPSVALFRCLALVSRHFGLRRQVLLVKSGTHNLVHILCGGVLASSARAQVPSAPWRGCRMRGRHSTWALHLHRERARPGTRPDTQARRARAHRHTRQRRVYHGADVGFTFAQRFERLLRYRKTKTGQSARATATATRARATCSKVPDRRLWRSCCIAPKTCCPCVRQPRTNREDTGRHAALARSACSHPARSYRG